MRNNFLAYHVHFRQSKLAWLIQHHQGKEKSELQKKIVTKLKFELWTATLKASALMLSEKHINFDAARKTH